MHLLIQEAFGWGNDHLYSFFMSGESFDEKSEIGSPWSEAARTADQTAVTDLKLRPEQTFLYHFDYGDNHEFALPCAPSIRSRPQGRILASLVARERRRCSFRLPMMNPLNGVGIRMRIGNDYLLYMFDGF